MDTQKITNFLFEIASMRRLTRSHRQFITGVTDNIADHSFRVAVIGMVLAELEGVDSSKVLKICLFHDLAEARTGDANYLNKQYGDLREDEVTRDQMDGLPIGPEIVALLEEYERRESPESVVAKDADLVDQMILQQEYFRGDDENRNRWHNHAVRSMRTKSARELAERIRETNPLEWLYEVTGKKTNTVVGAPVESVTA